MYACTLPGPEKNNPNYVNLFYENDIQLQMQVAPPGAHILSCNQRCEKVPLPKGCSMISQTTAQPPTLACFTWLMSSCVELWKISIAFCPLWLSENPMPEVWYLASKHLYRSGWAFQVMLSPVDSNVNIMSSTVDRNVNVTNSMVKKIWTFQRNY